MPVHLNSFIKKQEIREKLLTSILLNDIKNPDEVFASKNKKIIHMTKFIVDQKTKQKIGKTIITMIIRENNIEVVDVDITLLSKKNVKLKFLQKLDKSSEATEYYEVCTISDERHFQIETVNRCSLKKTDIENTKQHVYLSCFPFELNIFNDMHELNQKYGFSQPVKTNGFDLEVYGYAEDMIAVGGMFTSDFDEPSSFIIGKIKEFRDVNAIIGEMSIQLTIIQTDTYLGIIPVVTSREQFDLENLSVGKVLCMLTDVKADFKK